MPVRHRRPSGALFALLLGALLPGVAGAVEPGTISFVESFPAGTALDLPDLEEAAVVWPRVIDAADARVRVASFYFSRIGDGRDAAPPAGLTDRLLPSLAALRAAAGRGVKVQLIADSKFMDNYPEVPGEIGALDGAETRILDGGRLWGGIQHAKYMVLDDDAFFVGSQNWDWRALDQIHELGALVRQPELAARVAAVFDLDWSLAADPRPMPAVVPDTPDLFTLPTSPLRTAAGAAVGGLVAASPPQALPEGVPWDLPLLVDLIDAAQDSVHLQLLSYGTTDREQRLFDDLDRALRRAAVRGAQVRIIVSNWSKTKYKVPWLKSLAVLPGIEVRFTNIPEHARGFIPFARVEHAKYLTVDGRGLWLGTSNWSRDYFFDSRNLSLFVLGEGAPADPDRFFNLSWHGPYAETLEPAGEYAPPRRN
ncbi:hypothetical protein KDM41_07770 [bacterium]|nr:hypothetical protein [bacterium]